jgi:hypothetical protein
MDRATRSAAVLGAEDGDRSPPASQRGKYVHVKCFNFDHNVATSSWAHSSARWFFLQYDHYLQSIIKCPVTAGTR